MNTSASTHNPILPLPPDVRARLRSTVTITSLTTALSELVQNSLDAHATSLAITANLTRNSCTITDNGYGIPSSQLPSVATLYNTSKYPPSSNYFGSRGEALSALAQHAMLSVTSRADGYRSSNMIRWAYGKMVFHGPAPEHLTLAEHGTTVRVDGLWANMPVRLKAREGMDKEKEWEGIVRCVVELLMSGRGEGVAVVVRDENATRRLVVKGGGEGPWDMRVLRMAGISEEAGWEPVKAKQRSVKIEGWISTKGAVGRGCQFLYLNGFPLSSGNTVLHAEINRIFTNSAFGVVEDADDGRKDVVRRSVQRKSAERKGMFVLRIECRNHVPGIIGGEGGTEGKSGVEGENLKAVLELLQKLIYEFLKAHHFRPFKPSLSDNVPKPGSIPDLFALQSSKSSASTTRTPSPNELVTAPEQQIPDIADFSRAKTAKKDHAELAARISTKPATETSASKVSSLPLHAGNIRSFASRSTKSASPCTPDDEVLDWLNPKTGKLHHVDSRTGNVVVPKAVGRSNIDRATSSLPSTSGRRMSLPPPAKRIKTSSSDFAAAESGPLASTSTASEMDISPAVIPPSPGPFIQSILSKYRNPVFPVAPPSCDPIPTLSATTCCVDDPSTSPETHDFTISTSLRLNRITKSSLEVARVIAQVDDKYVLLLLPQCPSSFNATNDEASNGNSDMLVILDQHAASERIRVEALFSALCSPNGTSTPLSNPILVQLGRSEIDLITRHQSSLSRYGVSLNVHPSTNGISISALPAVAAERIGVVKDLAQNLIRRWAVELEEGLIRPPLDETLDPQSDSETELNWWTHLASIPTPLKDLVNSRACRGAVMFGDHMEMEECVELVRKLASTKWPFMCAHGRPSMRPLVELDGEIGSEGVGVGGVVVGGAGKNKDLGVSMRNVERKEAGFREMWKTRKWAGQNPIVVGIHGAGTVTEGDDADTGDR